MQNVGISPKAEIVRRSLPQDISGLQQVDTLLQRIFAARGVLSAEELNLDVGRLIAPQHMDGVESALGILVTALRHNQKIMIVGDYDADGATGTALAVRGLKALGFWRINYLAPDRFRFGYGLSPEIVQLALKDSPDLIITVDNGVSSIEGVAAAKEAGVQVIVTDHHLPGEVLPGADAIINPNLDGASFPSKALAGVGVMFYLLLALRTALRDQGWFAEQGLNEPNLGIFTDLVALGTVADVVPMDKNNRILVQLGLNRIRSGRSAPGIKALLEVANRNYLNVTSSDLGFAAAPRLNAAGRLDDMTLGIECLLSDVPAEALRFARKLDDFNRERRGIEAEMREEAETILQDLIQDRERNWPYGVCLQGENWHQGVVGIVASKVKEQLHRPVIAFAPAGDSTLKGSGRSVEGVHLRDVLDAIAGRYPGLIMRFGGHAMAAGLTLNENEFDRFHQAFDEEVTRQVGEAGLQSLIYTDGSLEAHQFDLETAQLLRDAGPWGQKFPEPTFDGWFRVVNKRIVGERHLKLMLQPDNADHGIDAIAFFMADWFDELNEMVRAVYRLDVNEFRGERNVQLQILHLES